jgi:phage portal protein BeeE
VDYGLPRDNALGIDYAGDKMASETNLSFFDSSGTPPKLIFVQGEKVEGPGGSVQFVVPPGLTQSIGELIKSDGGAQKRVGIIPLPPGSQTNEVELGQISDRDIGFTEYRKSILRNQLGAFRISPIFVSSAEAGRYTAEVERAITLEQVFDPDQRRWEDRLHETIYKDLGIPQLVHRFKRLAIEGDATRRESARALAERGALTNREYRAAHGLGPLPEAPEGQEPQGPQVPHGWNDELVVGDKGPPPSEREVLAADDQRGLRPRLAGREVREQDPALANGDSPLPPD